MVTSRVIHPTMRMEISFFYNTGLSRFHFFSFFFFYFHSCNFSVKIDLLKKLWTRHILIGIPYLKLLSSFFLIIYLEKIDFIRITSGPKSRDIASSDGEFIQPKTKESSRGQGSTRLGSKTKKGGTSTSTSRMRKVVPNTKEVIPLLPLGLPTSREERVSTPVESGVIASTIKTYIVISLSMPLPLFSTAETFSLARTSSHDALLRAR